VKERKGPFGLMVGGIVDSVVQTARRRAQDREPRALVYDASGRPRLLKQGDAGRDGLVETGGRLIELAGAPAGGAEDEPDEGDVAAAEAETQAEAESAGADEHPGETPA
jgi:hypothetical protein